MKANTTNPGLIGRIDQAAKGRVDGWLIGLGRRHPISWGIGRGVGVITWTLPKRAVRGTRSAYRRWSDAHTVTKTFHIGDGTVTTHKGPTAPPSGPAAPVATVTNINAPKQKQKQKQAKRPQTKGTTMAQATTELNKHTAGKAFAQMATSIDMFDPNAQYKHLALLEFLDDTHTGFDRVAAGLDEYADRVFAIGAHPNVMADLFGAVDDAEQVMDAVADARRRVLALYEDIISQETSNVGKISAASTRGGAGTGINGTGKHGKDIGEYYASVQFTEGTEASQILADLRAAQRGYAAAKRAFDDVAAGLAKGGFHVQVRDRVHRIGDEATATATALRRTNRTLMHLYAPQLRHEAKTAPHLRVV